MPTVRDFVLQQAKLPAKMMPMDRVPGVQSPAGPSPNIVTLGKDDAPAPDPGGGGPPPGAKPPRPQARVTSGGSEPGKRSEMRKPRAGGPGATGRAPSEPPRSRRAEDAESQGSGQARKAPPRAHSLGKVRVGDTPPESGAKCPGKVPAYLRRRQEELAEEKRIANRPISPQPPPGFRKVLEQERQDTIAWLRQRKAEVQKAQSNLPFKIETIGQKQREKDLESRLGHVTKLMDMFSKPVVFIPEGAEPISVSVPPLQDLGTPGGARAARPRSGGAAGGSRPSPRGQAVEEPTARAQEARPASGSSRGAAPRLPSRESRAAASAARRAEAAPWEQDGRAMKARPIKTGVQIAAPPGGRSSLNLGWD